MSAGTSTPDGTDQGRREQAITLETIEVTSVLEPMSPDPAAVTSWPCPGCGVRRPTTDGWHVRIRNRTGPSLERPAALCVGCVERSGGELPG